MDYWPGFLSAKSYSSQIFSKIKPYRWNRIWINCRYWYVGSISMKDFTLPRRDFEIKLCKCGLLALILIRTVLFKPDFLTKTKPYRWNRTWVNCRHCYVGSISMKDFTLSSRDFEIIEPTYQCLQSTRNRFQRYGLILEKTGLKRTVRIRIRANNPHLHNFSEHLCGGGWNRFWNKIVQMWIFGPDSYPHSPLQASFLQD